MLQLLLGRQRLHEISFFDGLLKFCCHLRIVLDLRHDLLELLVGGLACYDEFEHVVVLELLLFLSLSSLLRPVRGSPVTIRRREIRPDRVREEPTCALLDLPELELVELSLQILFGMFLGELPRLNRKDANIDEPLFDPVGCWSRCPVRSYQFRLPAVAAEVGLPLPSRDFHEPLVTCRWCDELLLLELPDRRGEEALDLGGVLVGSRDSDFLEREDLEIEADSRQT